MRLSQGTRIGSLNVLGSLDAHGMAGVCGKAVFVLLFVFSASSAFAQNRYYLPQIANGMHPGGSYRTTFILFNNNNAGVSATLRLTNDGGGPLNVTIPGLGAGSQFTVNLTAGSSRIFQTDGSGELVVGAATVDTTTAPIGVSAIFTLYDTNGNYQTEAGVGSSELLSEFVFPVDVTGPFNTGVALFNGSTNVANVNLVLINANGQQTLTTTKTLAPGAHLAVFVAGQGQLFPSINNFRGTLLVQSSAPIAALVLRQNETPLSYTSLPVVSRSTNRTVLNIPHVASGLFEQGSFKTSFLIFNPSANMANGTLILTKSDGSPMNVTIPGIGTSDTFTFSLNSGASIFAQTDGLGPLAVGVARIESTAPVGASAIFTVFDSLGNFQTEAGVGSSESLTLSTIPVDTTAGGDTGVAFFNPGAASTTLTLRLLDAGGVIAAADSTLNLPGRNHLARFVSELFPGKNDFQGMLSISATNAVAALTLRQNAGPSYTTLPVAAGVAAGIVVLTAPAALTAATTSSSSIRLNWTDTSSTETGFKIERGASSGGPFSEIGTAGQNISTYNDTGLAAPSTYYYRVRAYNSAGNSTYSNTASATIPPPASGAGLSFANGSYWEYLWTSESSDFTQGSGTTSESKSGKFRVTLGPPETVGGRSAFPVVITGANSDGVTDFAPDWRYLSVEADGSIDGSTDGTTFSLVASFQSTSWNDGGFFVPFPGAVTASVRTFQGEYNVVSGSIEAGRQSTSGGCTYYPSVGQTVCAGDPLSITEHEYYKAGVGPIGYKFSSSQTFTGGGLTTVHTRKRVVELIGTSFSASDGTVFRDAPWQEMRGLTTSRHQHAAIVLSGRIHVLGGLTANNAALSSVEIYDPASDTWTAGIPMPVPLFGHTAEVVEGKIYVIPSSGTVIYVFNPATNSWSTAPRVSSNDPSQGSCPMLNDYVVTVTPDPFLSLLNVPFYRVSTNTWAGGMSFTTSDRRWFSVACIDTDLYLAGGYRQFLTTKVDNSILRYHALELRWSEPSARMSQARYSASAVTFNGEIVVLGGRDTSQTFRSVEAYSPTSNTWRSFPAMIRGRIDFDAVVLNGMIYVLGGKSGSSILSQVERYSP